MKPTIILIIFSIISFAAIGQLKIVNFNGGKAIKIHNKPIHEVITLLAKEKNYKLIYSMNELPNEIVEGKLPLNIPIDDLLKAIQFATKICCKIVGNTIIVSNYSYNCNQQTSGHVKHNALLQSL